MSSTRVTPNGDRKIKGQHTTWNTAVPHCMIGIQTLQIRDSSEHRLFGTSAELFVRHIGNGAEVSRHIGTDVLQILTGDSSTDTVAFPS